MAKRALCVGINDYPGTNSDLSGCVNDANDWAQEWRRGYQVTSLLDKQATRQAMVDGLTKLVTGAAAGDSSCSRSRGMDRGCPMTAATSPTVATRCCARTTSPTSST